MEKTDRSGFLWFPRALKRREMFPDLCAAVDWVRKGSHHTAWSVPSTSSCSCSYAYGHGKAVGPQTGEQFWPLLVRLRRAIAPLMKTWCAGGEVASAANLNLYRGGNCMFVGTAMMRVGVEKLVVSVSFGTQALFRSKGKSCPDGEAGLCCISHGDILVMDGQCQDEFLHCTDPGLERERINVTFRWIRQHTASCPLRTGVVWCLPTCAQGSSAAVTSVVGYGAFGAFWVLLGVWCVYGREGAVLALLVFLHHVYRTWFTEVCLPLDTPFGRRSVVAYSCVTLVEFTGLHNGVPYVFMVMEVIPFFAMLHMVAFAGPPSLHGYCACMENWDKGA